MQVNIGAQPEISIVIPAFNEESNIARTLDSLLDQTIARSAYEIIVVDNNSTDRTVEIAGQYPVTLIKNPLQGAGPSKQAGLQKAVGKYVLNADADVIYPKDWIKKLVTPLYDPGIVCTFSKHKFLPGNGYTATQLFILSKLRDVLIFLKSLRKPWLNVYGMSMGYRREQALSIGFDLRNLRGEDGRLAYDLSKQGKIKMVNCLVLTHVRTLQRDGNFAQAIKSRLKRELLSFTGFLRKEKDHDTKTSLNSKYILSNKTD